MSGNPVHLITLEQAKAVRRALGISADRIISIADLMRAKTKLHHAATK